MNQSWTCRDQIAACDEGRRCELARRATFLVLFTPQGRPGWWLMLLAGLWSFVAVATFTAAG